MCLKTGAVKDVWEIDERADVSHVSSNVVERDNSSGFFDAELFIRATITIFQKHLSRQEGTD